IVILGIAWAIGTPIVALIALARTSSLREENARLAADLARLRREVSEGAAPPAAEPSQAAVPAPPPAPMVEETALPPPFEPEPVTAEAPPAPAWEPTAPQPAAIGWEQRLGARAFIWIGAVTLALAAI